VTKHWISYLLISLVACQSVIAFADSHETQITFPAIEFEQYQLDQSKIKVNEINEQDATQIVNIDNCDHCGFCHHGQLVPSLLSFSSSPNTALLKTQHNDVAPSGHLFSFYRPPKV
jgi:hypothetical protein